MKALGQEPSPHPQSYRPILGFYLEVRENWTPRIRRFLLKRTLADLAAGDFFVFQGVEVQLQPLRGLLKREIPKSGRNLAGMVDLKLLRDQGEAAWGAGHWEPARAAYAAIVECDPADSIASCRWIECLLALGSIESAMLVVEQLLDRLEERGEKLGALTIAESLLQHSTDPVAPLKRAIRLHFELNDTTAGLGRLRQLSDWYLEEGQNDHAIEVLRQAQDDFPSCVDIGMELGHLLIALGYIEEGTEQFRRLGHQALDHNVEDAMEAFRRWDFLKRLNEGHSG